MSRLPRKSSVQKSPPSSRSLFVREELDYSKLPTAVEGAPIAAFYVHVPFCTTKCHYCDFYSVAGKLDKVDAYLRALATEMALLKRHFWGEGERCGEALGVKTIFIGGGTPTLLDEVALGRLLEIVWETVELDSGGEGEFTIEANPNTFDRKRAQVLAKYGVNRISFGAQSFVLSELQMLQREHDPEQVSRAMEMAAEAGIENINLDLIFGIPGQTAESWNYSLTRALALKPSHLSCYSLSYEENTRLTKRMEQGDFLPLDEEQELAIFQLTYQRLREAGYQRYEVSNYAQPGKECRHNLHYWKGANYLAAGPSGASGYEGWHWKNIASVDKYIAALKHTEPMLPLTQVEHLSAVRRAGEVAMLCLRLAEGIKYEEFTQTTGVDAHKRMEPVLRKYAGMGVLEATAEGVALTEQGVVVSDAIVADVLSEFEDETTDR